MVGFFRNRFYKMEVFLKDELQERNGRSIILKVVEEIKTAQIFITNSFLKKCYFVLWLGRHCWFLGQYGWR